MVSGLFPRDVDPTWGIFVHRQIRALRDLGVDARVLCPVRVSRVGQIFGADHEREEWDGVPVRYFAYWPVPMALSPTLHGRSMVRALSQALRREPHRPDLYHAHWLFPTAWAAGLAAAQSGVPLVVSARGSDVHTYPARNHRIRRLTREAMARAALVTAVSGALARQAKTLGPVGMEVEVVHNGVDEKLFCPPSDRAALRRNMGLSEKRFYWISVCTLARSKGTAELLGAFARLARRCAHANLLLVGEGREAASLQRQCTEMRLAGRVVFAGRRQPEEVAHWLQAADAFVLASHAEGLPNAVLEAMATGLPVVATDVGGTREAVVHGLSGLLVPPRDEERLADAMRRISEDQGLAAEFGAQGRKRVERSFGWTASAQRWIGMYETVLRANGSRAG